MNDHKCSVPDCSRKATAEVMLYDVLENGNVFFEQDFTCPYLCPQHIAENEQSLIGNRNPETISNYKYSNKHAAQGFTVYRPLTHEQSASKKV